MRHLFISYAREDHAFAEELEEQLIQAGFRIWKDSSEIAAGDAWRASIDAAIDSCAALLLVYSAHAAQSEYVNYEWARALGASVRVVPILLDDVSHPRLAAIQGIDFRSDKPWGRLLAELGALKGKSEVPAVVGNAAAGLDDPQEARQLEAVRQLAGLDHQAARDALIGALDHSNRRVARLACLLLGGTDAADAVAALMRHVAEEDSRCRLWALWALSGRRRPAPVVKVVRAFLASQDEWARAAAVRCLGHGGDPADLQPIAAALRDPSPAVRGHTVEALVHFGERAIPAVLDVVGSEPTGETNYAAATVLGQIGDDRVVPFLASLLRIEGAGRLQTIQPDFEGVARPGGGRRIKDVAAAALERIGTPAARAALASTRSANSPEVGG